MNKPIAYFMFGILAFAVIRKFYMIGKPEKLNGILNGFLEFQNDFIVIDDKKIDLSMIKTISIYNGDYFGKSVVGNTYASDFSNGVDNQLIIILNNGTETTTYFQLYNKYDMGKIQDILIYYHTIGKISFKNLSNVLKLSKSESLELENSLKENHLL
ncbi:hypothetical protein LZQ00_03370 [Sphingobacterium sp. SRCM116780]|uniref:hypothetical protein n=1 Tax=Sphingobacterium sp. SRCM116780 TaxID=2907623 RepID=UPI001F1BB516|nr:hypothetical protein [Sphingobacterium sp. SRCM116780]UIR56866.1 hypothetical protein LZQ00_03370 [Sphingobacterium sp. SRCM116780]